MKTILACHQQVLTSAQLDPKEPIFRLNWICLSPFNRWCFAGGSCYFFQDSTLEAYPTTKPWGKTRQAGIRPMRCPVDVDDVFVRRRQAPPGGSVGADVKNSGKRGGPEPAEPQAMRGGGSCREEFTTHLGSLFAGRR
jgi:hypothetical protein